MGCFGVILPKNAEVTPKFPNKSRKYTYNFDFWKMLVDLSISRKFLSFLQIPEISRNSQSQYFPKSSQYFLTYVFLKYDNKVLPWIFWY